MNTDNAPLAQETAKHLPGWTANLEDGRWPYLHHEESGMSLWLHSMPGNSERVVICAGAVTMEDGTRQTWRHLTGLDVPEITVARSRGPQAVAREIQRRLLPALFPVWEKVKEQLAIQNAYAQGVKDTQAAFLKAFNGSTRASDGDRIYVPLETFGYVEVPYVGNGFAQVKLYVNAKDVESFAQWVKEHKHGA